MSPLLLSPLRVFEVRESEVLRSATRGLPFDLQKIPTVNDYTNGYHCSLQNCDLNDYH